MSDEKTQLRLDGSLGIGNRASWSMLHLGNCTVAYSVPVLVFSKTWNVICLMYGKMKKIHNVKLVVII